MLQILQSCISILHLQYPVRFTVRTKAHRKNYAGDANIVVGKRGIRYHNINLYLPGIELGEYNINGILAHELIHSWQFENVPGYADAENRICHGPTFAEKAQYLHGVLEYVGVRISMLELYNPEIDTP